MSPRICIFSENPMLSKEVNEIIYSDIDAVIVIGSSLTSLLTKNKIVKKLAKRKIMIINIDIDIRRNICNPINITPQHSASLTLSNLVKEFFTSAIRPDMN